MTNEQPFKASNGWTVQKSGEYHKSVDVRDRHGGYVKWISPSTLETLAEYLQHERDTELGRVRWPEDPDYVIYRAPEYDDEHGHCVRVLHEPSGIAGKMWDRWTANPIGTSDAATRWYFTEGPGKEPERPWEDAQVGEVWRLTYEGEEQNAIVVEADSDDAWFNTSDNYISAADPHVTAGRKLANADGGVAG